MFLLFLCKIKMTATILQEWVCTGARANTQKPPLFEIIGLVDYCDPI